MRCAKRVRLLAGTLLWIGCSEDPGSAPEQAPTSEVQPAEPESAEPETEAAPAEDPRPVGEPLELRVKDARLANIVPSGEPPALRARVEGDQLAVELDGVEADCRDVPALEATAADGTVTLRLPPPPDGRQGCVGPHEMELRIAVPRGGVEQVRIVTGSGRELAAQAI